MEEPTRDKSFLDLILCSDETIVDNLVVGEQFETSDHQIIRFNINCSKVVSNSNKEFFNYYKADYNKILSYIDNRGWDDLLDINNVEDM